MGNNTVVNGRDALDKRIMSNEDVTVDEIKAELNSDYVLKDDLRLLYAELLLRHALEARDGDSATFVAGLMDADPRLDQELATILNDNLEDQPDAVYAFIRAHLTEKVEKRW